MPATTDNFPLKGRKIWVSGHKGMVGSAIIRRLEAIDCEIVTVDRNKLDLLRQKEVEDWLSETKPDAVFVAAATVGGILANDTRPAEFLYNNLMIESNIIHSAYKNNVSKLLFLGSTCIYPKMAKQPIKETELLTGSLEPTNEWYAIAKIAGIKLCQAYMRQYGCNFISAMPTNLYGAGDNYDLETSHVLPALIRKAHEAKTKNQTELEVWGSGTPMREFLYVDDLADALVFLMENYSSESHINVGTGKDLTIRELAETVCRIVGFKGNLVFDAGKPDGTPRKLTDVSKINAIGWKASTNIEDGISKAYEWFLKNIKNVRGI
ncbi:MAG: GDP-L-fucose synthase [Alphaproteobacteria bacterium]|nr:GDP-L-fucose synthase [Alphaproteobacteria bacterium]